MSQPLDQYAVIAWEVEQEPDSGGVQDYEAEPLASTDEAIDAAVLSTLQGRSYAFVFRRLLVVKLGATPDTSVLYGALNYIATNQYRGRLRFAISGPILAWHPWVGVIQADWPAINGITLASATASRVPTPVPLTEPESLEK